MGVDKITARKVTRYYVDGRGVKRLRERLGWTQAKLASELKWARPSLAKLESGKLRSVPLVVLSKLNDLQHDVELMTRFVERPKMPNRCRNGCSSRVFKGLHYIYSAATDDCDGPLSWQCVYCGAIYEPQRFGSAWRYKHVATKPITLLPGELRELVAECNQINHNKKVKA